MRPGVNRASSPSRLALLPLVAAPVLGVLSVMTVDSWLLLLAGASLGLGIAALGLRPRLGDLDVAVHLPARAELGAPVETRVVVRNTGRRTTPLARLTHVVAGLSDAVVVIEALPRGASAEVTVERRALARSRIETSRATLTSSAPLGLVVSVATVDLPTAITVHPALVPVRLPPARSGGIATDRARPDRSGVDVHGIREWRSGDEARQVHWRSTARRGRLVVLEREVPLGGALTVLVAGPAEHPGWEQLVSTVASTAVAANAAGRGVCLFAAQPGLPPLLEGHRIDLLDWCSALTLPFPPDRATIEAALSHAGHGGQLHIATTVLAGPWWSAVKQLAASAGVEALPLPGALR